MDKNSLQRLWWSLTISSSADEVEARQENMAKVTLVIANIMLIATLLALIDPTIGVLSLPSSSFPPWQRHFC